MFAKLLVVIVTLTLLAAAVLGLREQRLMVRHQIAQLHAAMDASRKQTWDLQVRVAEASRDQALRKSIEQAGLVLQPVVPGVIPGVVPALRGLPGAPMQPPRVTVAVAPSVPIPYARSGP